MITIFVVFKCNIIRYIYSWVPFLPEPSQLFFLFLSTHGSLILCLSPAPQHLSFLCISFHFFIEVATSVSHASLFFFPPCVLLLPFFFLSTLSQLSSANEFFMATEHPGAGNGQGKGQDIGGKKGGGGGGGVGRGGGRKEGNGYNSKIHQVLIVPDGSMVSMLCAEQTVASSSLTRHCLPPSFSHLGTMLYQLYSANEVFMNTQPPSTDTQVYYCNIVKNFIH